MAELEVLEAGVELAGEVAPRAKSWIETGIEALGAGDLIDRVKDLDSNDLQTMRLQMEDYMTWLAASLPTTDISIAQSLTSLIEVGASNPSSRGRSRKRPPGYDIQPTAKRTKSEYDRSMEEYFRFLQGLEDEKVDPVTAGPTEMMDVDDVPQNKEECFRLVGSLFKNVGMPYRRRRRFRKKRKKYVTKRGVRALIARDKYSSGQYITRQTMQYMQCISTFNNVGRQQFNFILQADLNNLITEAKLIYASTATTGGPGQPQDNLKLWYRKIFRTFMIHSSCNEVQFVTLWWIKCKQDFASGDPVTRWSTEYTQKNPVSGTGTVPFISNFMTYPTAHKQWTEEFDIVKKVKFILQPGQTVKWMCKQQPGTYVASDNEDSTAHLRGHTHWLMVETKGVPTQDTTTNTLVGKSLTGVDITIDSSYQIGLSEQGAQKATYAYASYGNVTAANTIAAAVGNVMNNTI